MGDGLNSAQDTEAMEATVSRRDSPPEDGVAMSLALTAAIDDAVLYARAARAEATQRAYRTDWRHFEQWCAAQAVDALPAAPIAVGAYLAAHATTLSPATLTRRLSAISVGHRMAGHHLDTRHPAIRDVMGGIRRVRGVAPRRATAATTPLIRRLISAIDAKSLIGLRDRALILIGFAAALRRSELVALHVRDVALSDDGAKLLLRRSKGDQEGAGEIVGVARVAPSPTCPVTALEVWLAAARITEGPIYRAVNRHGHVADTALDDRAVARIVQKLAAKAGLDP